MAEPTKPVVAPSGVPFKFSDGAVENVSPADISHLVKTNQGSIATNDDLAEQAAVNNYLDVRERNSGLGAMGLAGASKFAEGIAGPLPAMALSGVDSLAGTNYTQSVHDAQVANPITSGLALGAGMLVGSKGAGKALEATSGLSKAMRFTPMGAVARGGSLIGEGVKAVIPGTGYLSGIARGAASGAAAAAFENGLISAGAKATEDILGNHELNGEQLMGALGHGMVTGAPFGGILGGAGGAVAPLVRGAVNKIAEVGNFEERANKAALNRVTAANKGATNRVFGDIADPLEREARELEYGKSIRTDKVYEGAKTADDIMNSANVAKNEADDVLSGVLKSKKLDGLEFSIKPIAQEQIRIGNELLNSPIKSEVMLGQKILGDASTLLNATGGNAKLSQLHTLKNEWTKLANSAEGELAKTYAGFAKTAGDMIEEQATKALSDSPIGNLLRDYQMASAKSKLHGDIFELARDMAAKETVETAGSIFTSKGSALSGVGAFTGNKIGGFPGTFVGAQLGGMAGQAIQKYSKDNAARLASDVYGRIADLGIIKNALDKTNNQIERGIESWATGGARRTAEAYAQGVGTYRSLKEQDPATRFKPSDFEKISTRVQSLANNPRAIVEDVGKRVPATVRAAAPNTFNAMVMSATKGINYLAANMPTGYLGASSNYLQPALAVQRPPPKRELESFLRKVTAVENPFWILEEMKRGRVTKETIDVMKNVYPEMYSVLKFQASKAVAGMKNSMDRKKMMTMATLIGVPIGATTSPDYIKFMQSIHDEMGSASQGAAQGDPNAGSQPPARQADFAKNYETGMDGL